MALCSKCGTQVQDGVQFCPSCGQAVNAAQPQPQQPQYPPQQQYQQPPQQQYQQPQQQPQYPPQQQYGQPQQQQPQYPPQQQYGQPQQQYQQPGYPPPPGYYPQGAPQRTPEQEAQNNKIMSILSYCYILVLVPLITGAHKTSQFVKHHVNQGLTLSIGWVGYSIISAILSSVIKVRTVSLWGYGYYSHTPGWLSAILWLLQIPFIILGVMGILNAVHQKADPLPVIGGIKLIK